MAVNITKKMKIRLNNEQIEEYIDNCEKQRRLDVAYEVIEQTQSPDLETYKQNLINIIQDDLYLIIEELKEIAENENNTKKD